MRSVVILFTAVVVTGSIVGCREDHPATNGKDSSSKPLTDFGKLIAARPVPDLGRLTERSSPDYPGPDALDSFYDILKLRQIGDANAVPVLEKIILANLSTGRIHGYAATQALF